MGSDKNFLFIYAVCQGLADPSTTNGISVPVRVNYPDLCSDSIEMPQDRGAYFFEVEKIFPEDVLKCYLKDRGALRSVIEQLKS